jgi:hypothetical protein
MRAQAAETGDIQRMQAWAGQSVRLGRAEPAGRLVQRIWDEALALLKDGHADASRPWKESPDVALQDAHSPRHDPQDDAR